MESLSSSLMLGVTQYRNQPGIANKFRGQVGYALIAIVSTVESVIALTFSIGSFFLYRFNPTPFQDSFEWLKSSSFCVVWSLFDFIINPMATKLIADEPHARYVFRTRQFFLIPFGATI